MSSIIDMKCEDCNKIFEYDKGSILNSTPDKIKCPECKSTKTYRIYGVLAVDVAEGMCGNAKTGYSKGIVNHPSALSHGKGTKV